MSPKLWSVKDVYQYTRSHHLWIFYKFGNLHGKWHNYTFHVHACLCIWPMVYDPVQLKVQCQVLSDI